MAPPRSAGRACAVCLIVEVVDGAPERHVRRPGAAARALGGRSDALGRAAWGGVEVEPRSVARRAGAARESGQRDGGQERQHDRVQGSRLQARARVERSERVRLRCVHIKSAGEALTGLRQNYFHNKSF